MNKLEDFLGGMYAYYETGLDDRDTVRSYLAGGSDSWKLDTLRMIDEVLKSDPFPFATVQRLYRFRSPIDARSWLLRIRRIIAETSIDP